MYIEITLTTIITVLCFTAIFLRRSDSREEDRLRIEYLENANQELRNQVYQYKIAVRELRDICNTLFEGDVIPPFDEYEDSEEPHSDNENDPPSDNEEGTTRD